ncbi:MAG: succinate dehydrogenase [Halobacteriaceae archaeon]
MSEHYSSFQRGSVPWLLQRVTAAFLIVTLAFHFAFRHFLYHAYEVTFEQSAAFMAEWGYLLTMILFLVTATFHAVNGIYNALINQGLTGTRLRVAKYVLVLAGIAVAAQGARLAWTLADAGGLF